MIELTFCVPYESMLGTVHQVLKEPPFCDRIKKNVIPMEVKDVRGYEFAGDVIVARGIAANVIRHSDISIPVIELSITGYDIIQAIHRCKETYSARRIACIGSKEAMYGAGCVREAMQVELECYPISDEDEGERLVEKARNSGAEAIVGGLMVTKIARAGGFPAVMIESGYESIRQALSEAIRVVEITRAERTRVERFRTIMDYSYEGIIAIDEKGRISLFNKTAQDIINAEDDDLIGRDIEKFLPDIGLSQILRSGKEELEALRTLRNTMVSTNQIPVRIGSEIVGAVATFQKISRIQAVEENIRKKMHKKGLRAKYAFSDIMGTSPAILEAIATAKKYSSADSNILISGETGTGKELFAQSIHNASGRRNGPFVAVNCAAIPENLLESELFGYVEGAFTGAAKAGKPGLFELAHLGTIFLDEISELPLALQARLLRVLQEKEIMRLGDDRLMPVDVRVIAASNRQLKDLVKEGAFRKDLLYRIDVLRIAIPPLRMRKTDIPVLLDHFIRQNNRQFGKTLQGFRPDALRTLVKYEWPGNIRELVNICERLSILTEADEIDQESVEKVLDRDEPTVSDEKYERPSAAPGIDGKRFEDGERKVILAALDETAGNKKKAADLLGIDNSTLWRKMKKLGISDK